MSKKKRSSGREGHADHEGHASHESTGRKLKFRSQVDDNGSLRDALSMANRYQPAAVLRPAAPVLPLTHEGPLGMASGGYAADAAPGMDGLMRAGVETLADEMTREWLSVVCSKPDRQKVVSDDLERFNIRQLFRDAAAMTGYFGACRAFIDTGSRDPAELKTPLTLDPAKVGKGAFRRLILIDPVLMYPGLYDAADPLSSTFYTPQTWHALGREIHATRFLHFVQNEPPLILKPAYNFGGIPAVQIALDYLTHFTATREAAARLLKKFSLTVFKTNMQGVLYGDDDDGSIRRRVDFFARNRDNDGVFLCDFEDEDIMQINTPLSGSTDIVRQALEMLAAVWRMPMTKFLGVSPGGMNATGESDMRNWYDYVGGQQSKMFDKPMLRLLRLLQLNRFGQADAGCAWAWKPLWKASEREMADINKLRADTDAVLLSAGVISQEESRARLSASPDSGYAGMMPDDVPAPPIERPLPDMPEFMGVSR